MKQKTLTVEGIMCENCVKKVKETLLNVEGIEQTAVSEDWQEVTLLYDPERVELQAVKQMIEGIPNKSFLVKSL